VLDGVEPLQHPPGSPLAGELKDPGVSALLKALAVQSRGVCVVTTRHSITDLRGYRRTTAPEVELARLPREAGVKLLRSLEVQGTTADFAALVEEVKGHALTLTLLGRYLARACGGDIRRRRDLVRFEAADAKVQGGHAFRTMAAYETWLAAAGAEGRRELAVLSLIGLFDRPAEARCLRTLRAEPAIVDLTEPIVGLAEDDWELTLASLAEAKLVTVNRDDTRALSSLDAHPLLREYFANQLRARHPHAWRAAHRRLYEHLSATTQDKPKPTIGDLQPLYQAVIHACHAGLQQKACNEIYFDRILRGFRYYSTNQLGAFGADLGAIACFFEKPWDRISPTLLEADQAWLLSQAAFDLRALGRLADARQPMLAGLEIAVRQEDWESAAVYAGNLSELELALGDVAAAVREARVSVSYADRSGGPRQRISKRTTVADAEHQAGHRTEAEALYREAETMKAAWQPHHPLLNSLWGFRYCDLLLGTTERTVWERLTSSTLLGQPTSPTTPGPIVRENDRLAEIEACRAIAKRAAQTLEWAENDGLSLRTIALNNLTLGRAALYTCILGSSASSLLPAASSHIFAALDGLRRAGQRSFVPYALLTRACLRSVTGARSGGDSAQTDLDDAWEIAERGSMRLHLADIHLYRARLFRAVTPYPWATDPEGRPRGPQDDLAAARALIERCGYWRRQEELEDAEKAAERPATTGWMAPTTTS
jgi:hypothetical protein